MRLFIAVDISEEVVAAVADFAARLRQVNADVAWVKPGNFHLTLKFLGEAPDGRLGDIQAALDLVTAARGTFELEMRGTGCFPESGVPRVVWVGAGAGRDALTALAQDIEGVVEGLGFARERREYAAHLTIGRVRSPRGAERLRRLLETEAGTSFGRCGVNAVRLYQSTLSPGGSIYEVLHEAKLGKGA
jgi:RNA 2',3'-cyclic 3'-phosphodiesterase